jgi:hypothetical protein
VRPLDRLRDEHRHWLSTRGLLDRPWFVLGSAPNPTIPPDITSRAALICINNAGTTAVRMGLPPADLTFRNNSKGWLALADCKVPLVLWVTNRNPLHILWKRMFIRTAGLGEIKTLRRELRRAIDLHVLSSGSNDEEQIKKPSTGIFAITYALFVGVPEIILAGMSIDKKGYSYDAPRSRMLHSAEDRFALERIAAGYPSVRTSEPAIADETGIRPYGCSTHSETLRRSG